MVAFNAFHRHLVKAAADSGATPGHESKLRLYDLQRPDAEPAVLTSGPDKPRAICLHTQDDLLLMSYLDKPGIR